jgi:hypothetical protein
MWPPPSTFPVEPPIQPGWWTTLSFDRWIAGVAADVRDARQAAEQAKRIRRLRRRVERVDEQIVLAMSASEARQYRRRYLYQHGTSPYESRSVGPDEVEHFTRPGGRILSVR